MNCIFCQFAVGAVHVDKILENDYGFVIKTIGPLAPHHVLVIPKVHVDSLATMSTNDRTRMLPALFELAEKYVQTAKLYRTGYRTVFNTGPDAYQTVFHMHMHVIGGAQLKKEIA